jgi:hypothetical protein
MHNRYQQASFLVMIAHHDKKAGRVDLNFYKGEELPLGKVCRYNGEIVEARRP